MKKRLNRKCKRLNLKQFIKMTYFSDQSMLSHDEFLSLDKIVSQIVVKQRIIWCLNMNFYSLYKQELIFYYTIIR